VAASGGGRPRRERMFCRLPREQPFDSGADGLRTSPVSDRHAQDCGLADAAKPEGGTLTAAEEARLAKLLKSGESSPST